MLLFNVPAIDQKIIQLARLMSFTNTENRKKERTTLDLSDHQPQPASTEGVDVVGWGGVGQTDEAPRGGRQFKTTATSSQITQRPIV